MTSVSGHLTQKLMAVDGSVVKTLKSIAEAAFMSDKNGGSHSGWRLHTHFDIDRHVPSRIEVTPGSNSGHNDEKNRLRKSLLPDHCYVMDRWYAQFTLWNDIVAANSSYVCRIRDNSNLDLVVEERAVSPEAAAAGVLRDIVVDIGANSKPDARPNHRVRVILVKCEPHTKRGGRKGGTAGSPSDGMLRIATNLLDVPAEIIADIYRHRWTIEVRQADCISRYTLYQSRDSAHSKRYSVVESGTMEPDTPAIEPRRTTMRRVNERLGPPQPDRPVSPCPPERTLEGVARPLPPGSAHDPHTTGVPEPAAPSGRAGGAP